MEGKKKTKEPKGLKIKFKMIFPKKRKNIKVPPQSYIELKKLVDEFIQEGQQQQETLQASISSTKIIYDHSSENQIEITNDESIQVAYTDAQENFKSRVIFLIQNGEEVIANKEKDKKTKGNQKLSKEEKALLKEERKKSRERKKAEKKMLKQLQKELDTPTTDAGQPQFYDGTIQQQHFLEQLVGIQTSGDDYGQKKTKVKAEKPKKEKAQKESKDQKTLKMKIIRIIMKELDRSSKEIFEAMKKANQEGKQLYVWEVFEKFISLHQETSCADCGMTPIIGVLFKCNVCQNYNICEICERKSPHEHSFQKIKKLEGQEMTVGGSQANIEQQIVGLQLKESKSQKASKFQRGEQYKFMVDQLAQMALTCIYVNKIEDAVGGEKQDKKQGKNKKKLKEIGSEKWVAQRAVVLNGLDQVYTGKAGETLRLEIEVENQTKWPWKKGSILTLSKQAKTAVQFEIINEVIDFKVKGMQKFKKELFVRIPQSLDQHLLGLHEVSFQFFDENEQEMGNPFIAKIQLN